MASRLNGRYIKMFKFSLEKNGKCAKLEKKNEQKKKKKKNGAEEYTEKKVPIISGKQLLQLCTARTVFSILVTIEVYTVMPAVCRWLTNEKQRKTDIRLTDQ